MNKRIDASDIKLEILRITRTECGLDRTSLKADVDGSTWINGHQYDDEALRALADAIHSKLDTGDFAALSDESAGIFIGKWVRIRDRHDAEYQILAIDDSQEDGYTVYAKLLNGYADWFKPEWILPLAPKPSVRPYTPVEAAAHLGRELEYQHKYHYLAMVGENHVELSAHDNGTVPKILLDFLPDVARWRDDSTPCGVCGTPES